MIVRKMGKVNVAFMVRLWNISICSFQCRNIRLFKYSKIRLSQAKVGAIVEQKQGTAKSYFNTSDMR